MSDMDDYNEHEEFDFQYSDDDDEEVAVDLENRYYEAKGEKAKDPKKAIQMFLDVAEAEGDDKGEW